MILFRLNAPLVFFNTDYFKQQAIAAVQQSDECPRWFVIDAIPISEVDVSGIEVLKDLHQKLEQRNILLVWAGRQSEILDLLEVVGLSTESVKDLTYPTLRQAVHAFKPL